MRAPAVHAIREEHLPSELVELRDALDRLPWRQRAALILRYFVDIPDDEIAENLHCRPATVRSLIRRGIGTLREVLT
jgi:RNA polymerase sigma factor (sigma-70 family)